MSAGMSGANCALSQHPVSTGITSHQGRNDAVSSTNQTCFEQHVTVIKMQLTEEQGGCWSCCRVGVSLRFCCWWNVFSCWLSESHCKNVLFCVSGDRVFSCSHRRLHRHGGNPLYSCSGTEPTSWAGPHTQTDKQTNGPKHWNPPECLWLWGN